jgi:hypothetical protein
MKNYLIALLGSLLLFFTGCSKNESSTDLPSIPDSFEIDIDEDGIADYKLQFDQPTIDGPDNPAGLVGRILRYGENEILQNSEERNLFLRNLENIQINVVQPLKWESTFSSTTILSITTNAMGEWPSQWDVNSDMEQSSYFLGLKMISDNSVQLAWLEFVINKNDGNVSIINKGIL